MNAFVRASTTLILFASSAAAAPPVDAQAERQITQLVKETSKRASDLLKSATKAFQSEAKSLSRSIQSNNIPAIEGLKILVERFSQELTAFDAFLEMLLAELADGFQTIVNANPECRAELSRLVNGRLDVFGITFGIRRDRFIDRARKVIDKQVAAIEKEGQIKISVFTGSAGEITAAIDAAGNLTTSNSAVIKIKAAVSFTGVGQARGVVCLFGSAPPLDTVNISGISTQQSSSGSTTADLRGTFSLDLMDLIPGPITISASTSSISNKCSDAVLSVPLAD